ncbi:MAG: FMN-binding protein [Candidatus Izemoplasmatales bacterium]
MIKKICLILTLVFSFTIIACSSDEPEVEYPKTYNIVDVTAGRVTDDGVVMTLETDGFGGTMEVEVTINNSEIVNIEVINHSESDGYGKDLIEDGNFIQLLIDEDDDLDSIDIIDASAGSTLTGEALLDIAKTALEHYEDDYK